jgi:putative tryptophan/tyrosine transport system substrate-binding protein
MKRREFITLAGVAASWTLAARAQQAGGMRRIGVLMQTTAEDPESQARLTAFQEALQHAGWEVGRNVRIDVRWSTADGQLLTDAQSLVALSPDVLLAGVGATIPQLMRATSAVPIVFAQAIDPVGAGYVESLARPGGNATGFIQFEYNLAGKWLELLKEVAPKIERAAVLREGGTAGIGQWAIIQAVAQTLSVEPKPIRLTNADEIERAVAAFANTPNGGLIVVVSAAGLTHRQLILDLAARYQLPTVYPYRVFVSSGGLIAYGADIADLYRRAAAYVDRILKGEKPSDLPVQAPTKYELAINAKTAKALGLTIPPTLSARADEVIE